MRPKNTRKCPVCNTTFHPVTGEVNRGRGKFCSPKCATAFRQQPNTTCPHCGKAFRAKSRELNAATPPYCCRACYLEHRFGSPEDRFWSRVNRLGPDDCWEWQGGTKAGYGAFHFRGSLWTASRVAWTLVHGEIPSDLWVLHKCDNPPCCNPAHLFLGTPQANVSDMFSKGRDVHLHGSDNPLFKLTENDVQVIRSEYAAGGITQRSLAERYGVEQTTISWIIRRKTWKHVT